MRDRDLISKPLSCPPCLLDSDPPGIHSDLVTPGRSPPFPPPTGPSARPPAPQLPRRPHWMQAGGGRLAGSQPRAGLASPLKALRHLPPLGHLAPPRGRAGRVTGSGRTPEVREGWSGEGPRRGGGALGLGDTGLLWVLRGSTARHGHGHLPGCHPRTVPPPPMAWGPVGAGRAHQRPARPWNSPPPLSHHLFPPQDPGFSVAEAPPTELGRRPRPSLPGGGSRAGQSCVGSAQHLLPSGGAWPGCPPSRADGAPRPCQGWRGGACAGPPFVRTKPGCTREAASGPE